MLIIARPANTIHGDLALGATVCRPDCILFDRTPGVVLVVDTFVRFLGSVLEIVA